MQQTNRLPRSLSRTTICLAAVALAGEFAGCTFNNVLSSEKVDYKSGASSHTVQLDVPPDLTQLSRDTRYQTSSATGTVSAAAMQSSTQTQAQQTAPQIAAQAVGGLHIERQGNQRWLVTPLSAEQLWPVAKSFWQDQGFTLAMENAAAGVMETEWSENRAKLPSDAIRNTVGRFLDSVYDTGERDRFRLRLERTAAGTEVYISHRGLAEVYTSNRDGQTTWQTRPSDPSLEAEMLSRLMTRLGATPEQAKTITASAAVAGPDKARLTQADGSALTVDDGFDAAWRRVGLALDRGSFTVEDRDRTQGIYFVRYADPSKDQKSSQPGLFARIFGSSKGESTLNRYRVVVKTNGAITNVSVLDAEGAAANNETGKRIARLLVDELK